MHDFNNNVPARIPDLTRYSPRVGCKLIFLRLVISTSPLRQLEMAKMKIVSAIILALSFLALADLGTSQEYAKVGTRWWLNG